jgi:hypothetical protein
MNKNLKDIKMIVILLLFFMLIFKPSIEEELRTAIKLWFLNKIIYILDASKKILFEVLLSADR